TVVRVCWPDSACSILTTARDRFLQIADDYTFLNPHLALAVEWFGDTTSTAAGKESWDKWRPSDPTCPHWYTVERFKRLVSAYIAHDRNTGKNRTVRELVSEFRGLSGSAKQKAVLANLDLSRAALADLVTGDELDAEILAKLLSAMKAH